MEIKIIQDPDQSLMDFFEERMNEFNIARWEIKKKTPLALVIRDEKEEILAGASAKTFGYWLLIENLWVCEALRGQDMGSRILQALENAAIVRGCKYALLDTLDFQAKPFYEKHGYKLKWTQEEYPTRGAKHFMTKIL